MWSSEVAIISPTDRSAAVGIFHPTRSAVGKTEQLRGVDLFQGTCSWIVHPNYGSNPKMYSVPSGTVPGTAE